MYFNEDEIVSTLIHEGRLVAVSIHGRLFRYDKEEWEELPSIPLRNKRYNEVGEVVHKASLVDSIHDGNLNRERGWEY